MNKPFINSFQTKDSAIATQQLAYFVHSHLCMRLIAPDSPHMWAKNPAQQGDKKIPNTNKVTLLRNNCFTTYRKIQAKTLEQIKIIIIYIIMSL